jgi:signal peptidase I
VNLTGAEFIGLAEEALSKGGLLRFAAVGCSMHPFIRSGEYVVAERARPEELHYGDIVILKAADGGCLVHRIVAVRRAGACRSFTVKGDSLAMPDGEAGPGAIVGRVVAVEKARRVMRIEKGIFRTVNVLYTMLMPASRMAYSLYDRCVTKTGS